MRPAGRRVRGGPKVESATRRASTVAPRLRDALIPRTDQLGNEDRTLDRLGPSVCKVRATVSGGVALVRGLGSRRAIGPSASVVVHLRCYKRCYTCDS